MKSGWVNPDLFPQGKRSIHMGCEASGVIKTLEEILMTTEFSQLTLHPTLIQAAADLGFKTPTEVQTRVIPLML